MNDVVEKLSLSDIPMDKVYINGAWQAPHGTRQIALVSPDDEQVFAHVVEADENDVDRAVAAARKAFDHGPWPDMPVLERCAWLEKLTQAITRQAGQIALAWSRQIGVPYHGLSKHAAPSFTRTMEQYLEIAKGMEFVERVAPAEGGVGLRVLEPVGVVAAIAPWNVPVNTMLNKVGPALVTGCTVIMKPSPETPIEAYIIAKCADEIGLPKGVLNLICADRDVSDYLVRSEQVDKVSFTCSVTAGQRIASVCGERIGRVTLELGGKSAAIILDDYDIETAAEVLVQAICVLSGQNCAALSRILVSRNRQDQLVRAMKSVAENITIGHTFDERTELGPVAMRRQLEKIESYIGIGQQEGAQLVTGGKRPAYLDRGFFIEPTIFADVSNEMRIAREEIFGPVLCVIPCDDLDEAIAIANDSDFGLAGAVFTHDQAKAWAVARKMRTGTVGHNGPRADFTIGFGGFKKSGLGREGGVAGLRAYLEPKTVLLDCLPESFSAS